MEDYYQRQKAEKELYLTMDIGEKMLIAGAEVSRVEDTIRRICLSFGMERVDVLTITSSIIVTVYAEKIGTITQTRRIIGQSIDMTKLNELNQLSRDICSHPMTEDTIRERLNQISQRSGQEGRTSIVRNCFIFSMISASFTILFSGSFLDAISSAIVGVLLAGMDYLWKRAVLNKFLAAGLSSFLGGIFAIVLVYAGIGESVSKINLGNIMLLIPGMALTNSMRDIFCGDTITGTLRFVESSLLAITLAFGFVLSYKLCGGLL